MQNIEQLEAGLARCIAMECTCFVSFYSKKVHVSISKAAYVGTNNVAFDVKGDGDTVREAFERCFANFPTNPLDGVSKWASSQLPPPPAEDAVFTETDPPL